LKRRAAESKPPASSASSATAARSVALAPSIVVRLLATHNLLIGALRRGLAPELTLARFDLLAQLAREDGPTLASLSRHMLVTAGNLTGLVDRAERDGIVERRADPKDRRLTRVFLTTRGEKLAQRAIREHNRLAEELLAPMPEADRKSLRDLLGRLRGVLEDGGAAAAEAGAAAGDEDDADPAGGSRP
jgi:DNA-binding MarR family transcriptional regulator